MSRLVPRSLIVARPATSSVGHGLMLRIGSREPLRRFLNEVRPMVVGELDQRQRATLDIGSWLIMGTLGVGLQLGRWPAWSVLLATAGYLTWVLAYSEATVQ